VIFSFAGALSQDSAATKVFRKVSPSVVVIRTFDVNGEPVALGSGVALSSGLIITNNHVTSSASTYRVVQRAQSWTAQLTWQDQNHDLSLLSVTSHSFQGVSTRNVEDLSIGEEVFAIGAPEGLELSISEGIISGLRTVDEDFAMIQTTAAISHGSSGGGLFDTHGNLIGITRGFLGEGQNLNFAIPVGYFPGRVKQSNLSSNGNGEEAEVAADQQYTPQIEILFHRADLGDAGAWYELGDRFLNGNGVERDELRGLTFIGTAANMNESNAELTLAKIYWAGRLRPQSSKTAAELAEKSARHGNAEGAKLLGYFYALGIGVSSSSSESYKWYCVAGASPDTLNSVGRALDAQNIQKAQADCANTLRTIQTSIHAARH
jgi:hypothetical protein